MPLRRVHHTLQSDAAHIEMARQAIRQSMEVLKLPAPDTFLGREAYKPFPKENEEDNTGYSNGTSPEALSSDE